MLSLESPFYEISGVTAYRDHAVPTQFYYTAPQPRIARSNGRLIFDLMAYTQDLKHSVLSGTEIPDELGAGFLTMGTECPLSDMQRGEILPRLAELTGLEEAQISLYPVPYHKGTVSVLALDKFTAPAGQPADPGSENPLEGRPTFVEEILGTGQPSLLGDLRSIFSLKLTQNGVIFLEGLYADRAAPVGVVYDLKYHGLSPSVDAIVSADLSKVYERFGGGLAGQYYWFRAELNAAFERLRQENVIQIRLTRQLPGEEGQKAEELALSLFRDRIIQELFRPTAPPLSAANIPGLGGMGNGSGSTALVTLTLQYRKEETLQHVDYDFHGRAPVERTHSPQGFLPVLLSPTDLAEHIHLVHLDSPFFEMLELLVTGPTKEEFEALGIRQVEATLTYGRPGDALPPESAIVVFRPDSSGDKTVAFKRRGRSTLAYTAALTYEFARTGATDTDSFRYDLPPVAYTRRSMRINPFADFGVLEVDVEPGRIHPDVCQVDVDLAYETEDGAFQAKETFRLIPGEATSTGKRNRWQVRTRQLDVQPYTATYTLVFDDGSYQLPPMVSTEPLLRVDTPFWGDRELLIQPNPTSDQVEGIIVELEYEDRDRGYTRRKRVELVPPFQSERANWAILDGNCQEVRYRVTVREPGLLSTSDWEVTRDPSIVVGAESHRVGEVQIQLVGPSLAEVGLDALQVKVALLSPDIAPQEPKEVLLVGDQMTAGVQLVLPPGARLQYRYQTLAFHSMDGTIATSQWQDMTSPLLVIQTRNL